jgi:hypothetical protein
MMPGARLARLAMIFVTVVVVLGLLVSAFATPQVY